MVLKQIPGSALTFPSHFTSLEMASVKVFSADGPSQNSVLLAKARNPKPLT